MIGLDFDNTIVCYDRAFYEAARERELVPSHLEPVKEAVKAYLIQAGLEDQWTALQGYVYGVAIARAEPFEGVAEFLSTHRAVCVISHKTRRPFQGPPYDLHQAARDWLQSRPELAGVPFYLEETKAAKLERIARCQCRVFVDDLPEILEQLPAGVRGILFDPAGVHQLDFTRARSWAEVARLVDKL